MNKVHIMNGKRVVQIEIEVQQMDEDKTIFFLVSEEKENEYRSFLQGVLWNCHYTIEKIVEDAKENNMDLYYMCTMYDDRIENEYK